MSKHFAILYIMAMGFYGKGLAQCGNGHIFDYGGKSYEIVLENKSWTAAATCAVSKGGYLAEINDVQEQEAIFSQIQSLEIDPDNTAATDGFSSYVWIGGNDIANEGNWAWNGNNDASGTPFWIGTASGTLVAGQYSNWGQEPDNWPGAGPGGQDGLGLAIIDWPLGLAGQWNDVNHNNTLYYIVEYTTLLDTPNLEEARDFVIAPIPAQDYISVSNNTRREMEKVIVMSSIGQVIHSYVTENSGIHNYDLSGFKSGVYFVKAYFKDGFSLTKKIIKD